MKIRGILSKDNTQLTCISYGFNLFKQTDYISVIYFTVNNVHVCIYAQCICGNMVHAEYHAKKYFSPTKQYTGTCNDIVKPAHVITSIKQLPALKDHLFLVLS